MTHSRRNIFLTFFLVSSHGRADGSTCADFVCADGLVLDKSKSKLRDVSDDNCCLQTCQVHTCTEGRVPNEDQLTSTDVTEKNCCLPTCATYSCQPGNSNNLDQATSTNVSEANCCHTGCDAYECPVGYKSDNLRVTFARSSISLATCCIAISTRDITDFFRNQEPEILSYKDLDGAEVSTRCCCEEADPICRLLNMSSVGRTRCGDLSSYTGMTGGIAQFYHSYSRNGRRCVIAQGDFETLPLDLQAKWRPPKSVLKVRVEKIKHIGSSGYALGDLTARLTGSSYKAEDTRVYVRVSLDGVVAQTRVVRAKSGLAIFNETLDLPVPTPLKKTHLRIEAMDHGRRDYFVARSDFLIGETDPVEILEVSKEENTRKILWRKEHGKRMEQGQLFIGTDIDGVTNKDEL